MGWDNMDEKLRKTLEAAYANAPAFRKRMDDAGLTPEAIQGVADLPKIPLVKKDELIALQQAEPPFGGMLGVPMSEVTHIFFSPGPLYEPGPEEDDSAWEVAESCLRQGGFQPGDIVLNSLSYHLVPAGFLLDRALVRLGCTVVPGGTGNSDLQLKMMGDLGCTGYVGTPSFLMSLIQKAEEQGLDFKTAFRVRKALVTAEPLPPSLRQTLTDVYGITITNAYGTADFGLLAISQGEGMMMQLLPLPIVELVDPDTGQLVGPGEAGEVVVTNFSRVYPLIRIGTGDLAMNIDPNPGQSRQEERGIILVGRSGDAVKVRGMFVHPNQLRFASSQVTGVEAIQGVVSRPDLKDQFALRVQLSPGADPIALSEQLKAAVRNVCRVRVDEVEFVTPGTLPADAQGMVDQRSWE